MGFVQITQLASTSSGVTSLTLPAFASHNIVGNRLVMLISWLDHTSSANPVSITDTIGNTSWEQIGTTFTNTVNLAKMAVFECKSCKAGANTPKVNFTTSVDFPAASCSEYSGSALGTPSYNPTYNHPASTSAGPAVVSLTANYASDIGVAWGPAPDNDDCGGVVGGNTQRGAIIPGGSGADDYVWAELVLPDTSAHNVGSTIGSNEFWQCVGVVIPYTIPPNAVFYAME